MKHLTLIYTENHPNFGELCNSPSVRGLIHKAGVGFEFLPDANPESKPIFKAKARMQYINVSKKEEAT